MSAAVHYLDSEVTDALATARYLIESGMPGFVAPPAADGNGSGGTGFLLPGDWQHTVADPAVVDRWRPGWALCLVTGVVADVVDVDPRNGGTLDGLALPRSYGRASTPSGGTHDLIAPLGVRSRNGVLPGVDLKAGVDGAGHGFVFAAPTAKRDKRTGELGVYRWTVPPDLTELLLVGADDTGAELRRMVARTTTAPVAYGGPRYADLDAGRRALADAEVAAAVARWRETMAAAAGRPEGWRDAAGRGWEALSRDLAWTLARLAVSEWSGLSEAGAEALCDELALVEGKWRPGLCARARAAGGLEPPWEGLEEADEAPEVPKRTEDAHLAAWIAHHGVSDHWKWAGGIGWMYYQPHTGVWVPRRDEDAREAVRQVVIRLNQAALAAGAGREKMRRFTMLLTAGRITALTSLMRGVLALDGSHWDAKPDLLCVGNGVVHLPSGRLMPFDPALLLSKRTAVDYVPGAEHPDWKQALGALDDEVADWMAVRYGQGVTGWPTSDDVLPICQGGGSNGKSTLLAGLKTALGDHMVQVPEKLLRGGAGDHPTELMTLRGARIAYVDETPEAGQLNVARLKSVLGAEWITARAVYRDNLTWKATHSLIVSTNYTPTIAETDHGTWRRLALVVFDRTFPRDDTFRARIVRGEDGIAEAVLAWVVDGARRWYAAGRIIPPAPARVEADTLAWRSDTDLVLGYVTERLAFDESSCVLGTDLHEDFDDWLHGRHHKPWSDKLFGSRFGGHETMSRHHVTTGRPRELPAGLVRRPGAIAAVSAGRPVVWHGLRWA